MASTDGQEPPRKRARMEALVDTQTDPLPLTSLATPITPPQRKSRLQSDVLKSSDQNLSQADLEHRPPATMESPFQLTRIQDLPAALNADTVTLQGLLSSPLIAECWEFNYLHDLDFLMESFDADIRNLVNVHVVHGFWKEEDGAGLKMQAQRYPNVTLHTAYMPEAFGTHHTKMMVLLRHDELAQIIIHTANLIRRDWRNLSQGVWASPLLPLQTPEKSPSRGKVPMGSGARFKVDFLNYLRAYNTRRTVCKPLVEQLNRYDFGEIRGAIVASVPGRHLVDSNTETKWGWQALREALSSVPVRLGKAPEITIQVSSIATLGQTNQWLDKTLFNSLATMKSAAMPAPKYNIIFPTPEEVRISLDGYDSGASIHTKIQTPAQQKQLQYLKPILCHWVGERTTNMDPVPEVMEAGRRLAAPHIKTYIRFPDASKTEIDWALLTSANISKQAWGEARNAAGEVRICSYELGVLVWPQLWDENAKMVPTFKKDIPMAECLTFGNSNILVGLRMPYDLPLVPYSKDEEPWCATLNHNQPDWHGNTWKGH